MSGGAAAAAAAAAAFAAGAASARNPARKRSRTAYLQGQTRSSPAPRRGFTPVLYRQPRLHRGPELKYKDENWTDSSISATGTVTMLGEINQGTSASERVGDRVTYKSIHARMNFYLPQQATGAALDGDVVRVMFFIDTKPYEVGTAIGVDEILDTENYLSFRNLELSTRFKVLKDDTFAINYTGATDGGGTMAVNGVNRYKEFNAKLEVQTKFNNATSPPNPPVSNVLYCLLIGATQEAGATIRTRIRFTG